MAPPRTASSSINTSPLRHTKNPAPHERPDTATIQHNDRQPTYSSAARASAYTTYTHAARRRPTGEFSLMALATKSSEEPSYMGADVHEKGKPVTRAGIYKPIRRAGATRRRRASPVQILRGKATGSATVHGASAQTSNVTLHGTPASQTGRTRTQQTAFPPSCHPLRCPRPPPSSKRTRMPK